MLNEVYSYEYTSYKKKRIIEFTVSKKNQKENQSLTKETNFIYNFL